MESSTGAGHPDRPDDETGQRPQAPAAKRADAPRWRRVFEGEERQLGVMRRWLASVLPACPARDDVISVATELASNALRHTSSGNGGLFAVEITWQQRAVRIGVADSGGPAEPHVIEGPDGEHGRGLLLVQGLSLRTGVTGDRHGRLVWADVAWDGPHLPSSPAPAGLDEAAIRDGEASLARRFAGVPTWFGRSTLAWWALASPTELVTAPTAPELAALLDWLLDAPPPARPGSVAGAHPDEVTRRYGLPEAPGRRPAACPGLGAGADRPGVGREPDSRRRGPGSGPGWPMASGWSVRAAVSGFLTAGRLIRWRGWRGRILLVVSGLNNPSHGPVRDLRWLEWRKT